MARATIEVLPGDYADLLQQRDELLAALEALLPFAPLHAGPEQERARAAIAKARGLDPAVEDELERLRRLAR